MKDGGREAAPGVCRMPLFARICQLLFPCNKIPMYNIVQHLIYFPCQLPDNNFLVVYAMYFRFLFLSRYAKSSNITATTWALKTAYTERTDYKGQGLPDNSSCFGGGAAGEREFILQVARMKRPRVRAMIYRHVFRVTCTVYVVDVV